MLAIAVFPTLAIAQPELVLQEDVRLNVTTASWSGSVVTGTGLERTYEWNGCSFPSPMGPRGSRWYGSLGIYGGAVGSGFLGSLLPRLIGCKGVDRTVVEEAQLHFAEIAEAELWVARYSKNFDTVWSNDGLVIQQIVSPDRRQLGFDVWQVCIDGHKPTRLLHATDEAIQVVRVAGSGTARHDCAKVGREVQLHTQRLWQAHWKQADEMNSRLKH